MFTKLFKIRTKNNSKAIFFFTSLIVICFLSFKAVCSEKTIVDPSKNINVINVFSGAPQAIDGPSKYAGFGDIAANLVAATEIKARYPNKTVRFIVTSAFTRIDPLIPTTDEIVKIMAPLLDPSRKGVVQMHGGVEVVFIPVDFKLVLYSADNLKEAEQLFWEDHPHDDIEIRRTVSLEEVKKGRVFGPIKER